MCAAGKGAYEEITGIARTRTLHLLESWITVTLSQQFCVLYAYWEAFFFRNDVQHRYILPVVAEPFSKRSPKCR